MKKKNFVFLIIILAGMTLILSTSCKREAVQEPNPLGPSGLSIVLDLSATPNALFAGTQARESATITARLKKYDGMALSGETIIFEIRDSLGIKVNCGFFEGNQYVTSRQTDGAGNVTLTYFGPLAQELVDNTTLYIFAHLAWEGKEEISELTPIYIVRDFYDPDLTFELWADPNVLWCTSKRPRSVIMGVFAREDGNPIVGRKVFFEILSGLGEFEDGKTKTYRITNSEGIASIEYVGPKNTEMTKAEDWVEIRGQPETYWIDYENNLYYLHKELKIRLKKGTN